MKKYWSVRNKPSHRRDTIYFPNGLRIIHPCLISDAETEHFLIFLKGQKRGFNLMGIDISEQALSVSREKDLKYFN